MKGWHIYLILIYVLWGFGLRSCLRFLKMLLIESPNSGSAETLLPKCGHLKLRLLAKIMVNLLHIERDTALVGGPWTLVSPASPGKVPTSLTLPMLTRPWALLILPPPHISASSLPLLTPLPLSKPLPLPRLDVQGDDAVVPLELLLPSQVPLLDLLVVVIRKLLIPLLLTATAATSIPHPDACDTWPFTFLFGFLRLHKRKSPNVQFCGRGNGNQTSLFEIGTPRVHLYVHYDPRDSTIWCLYYFLQLLLWSWCCRPLSERAATGWMTAFFHFPAILYLLLNGTMHSAFKALYTVSNTGAINASSTNQ